MTISEKVSAVQALVDNDEGATEELITVYLNLAKQKILDRIYPMTNRTAEVPEKYDMLHVELAQRMYLRRGGEGEINHEENGINRNYETVDDEDILSRLVPIAKVCG